MNEGKQLSDSALLASAEQPELCGSGLRRHLTMLLAVFLALLVGGFAGAYVQRRILEIDSELDCNEDGSADVFWKYRPNGTAECTQDHNFDGKVDDWAYYDAYGVITRQLVDTDFDGDHDIVSVFKNGTCARSFAHQRIGGPPVVEWHFRRGVAQYELHDTDGDGKLDRRIDLDHLGRQVSEVEIDR